MVLTSDKMKARANQRGGVDVVIDMEYGRRFHEYLLSNGIDCTYFRDAKYPHETNFKFTYGLLDFSPNTMVYEFEASCSIREFDDMVRRWY